MLCTSRQWSNSDLLKMLTAFSLQRRCLQLRHLACNALNLVQTSQYDATRDATAHLLHQQPSRSSSSFEFKQGSLRSAEGGASPPADSDTAGSQGVFQQGSFTQAATDDYATSSFGYQDVPTAEKTGLVGQVFSSVASSYDLMNDLMSVGLHRLWKDRLVQDLKPFAGMRHLDVAGGTGDVAFRVLDQILEQEEEEDRHMQSVIPAGSVTVCDINPEMLAEGRKKALAAGYDSQGLNFRVGNAESLPFPDDYFDAYTIAFGIRNVTHIDLALKEAHRVLRTGGRFLCLEFSHVTVPGFKELYDAYSFNVIPEIGRVVANDRSSYQYLVESIRKFPDQERFADMIRTAGFRTVEYSNIQGGIVALHSGFKV